MPRSGKSTYGAQHFASLIKWSAAIKTCIMEFNDPALALENVGGAYRLHWNAI